MQDNSPDIFHDAPDDDHPVSRKEMRQIVRDVRGDLRWAVVITVVANQGLNHVELPTTAGFVGGAAIVVLGAVKLIFVR